MELVVLGCHGGESPRHRPSSFLLDGKIGIDAGAITSVVELSAQRAIETVVVSHAHFDHVRDLATLADNRCQQGGPTLSIVGTPWTLDALKRHFFNNVLWPDFSQIPTPLGPTIRFDPVSPGEVLERSGYRIEPVLVTHTIECAAFVLSGSDGAIAYSGDTGPTEQLWRVLEAQADLKALIMEVSFPDEQQALAKVSGHLTPAMLDAELAKMSRSVPTLLFHMKPVFERMIEKEVAKLRHDLTVLELDDIFSF